MSGSMIARGIFRAHLAVMHGALNEKPACGLHQTRRHAHAFTGVEQCRLARKIARLVAAAAIEIACGFFDERHTFVEGAFEQCRAGERLQRHVAKILVFVCNVRHAPRPIPFIPHKKLAGHRPHTR
jgi:hypothetical protein